MDAERPARRGPARVRTQGQRDAHCVPEHAVRSDGAESTIPTGLNCWVGWGDEYGISGWEWIGAGEVG